jgi:hypothetical protein
MLDCHSLKGNYICNNTQPKAVFILLKVLIFSWLWIFCVTVKWNAVLEQDKKKSHRSRTKDFHLRHIALL